MIIMPFCFNFNVEARKVVTVCATNAKLIIDAVGKMEFADNCDVALGMMRCFPNERCHAPPNDLFLR